MPSCDVMPCCSAPAAACGAVPQWRGIEQGHNHDNTETDFVKSSQVFSDDWQTYQKLLEGNYMHHIELYQALKLHMQRQTQQGGGSCSVLDLGCGDSDHFARLLRHSPCLAGSITSYTGVDMSLPALLLSAENMRAALGPRAVVRHHQTDILGYASMAQDSWQQYDFVLASFSAHHLSAFEKQRLVELVVGKLLKPGGAFCLVDVFLQAGEQRGDFLRRSKDAYESLPVFTQEEKHKMLEHTTECDFPESVETYASWAASHGGRLELLADFGLFKAVSIQAPAAPLAMAALSAPLAA